MEEIEIVIEEILDVFKTNFLEDSSVEPCFCVVGKNKDGEFEAQILDTENKKDFLSSAKLPDLKENIKKLQTVTGLKVESFIAVYPGKSASFEGNFTNLNDTVEEELLQGKGESDFLLSYVEYAGKQTISVYINKDNEEYMEEVEAEHPLNKLKEQKTSKVL